jgi:hypothetical protein
MKTTAFMATAILSLSATALAQSTCDTVLNTGSMDVTAGGVSCAADGFTTPNNFAKSYDLATLLPGQDFELSCIEFGVGNSGTDIPARITVYTDTDGGVPQAPGIDLVELGSVDFTQGNSLDVIIQASFDPPLTLSADGVYVVELFLGASTDGFASIASNADASDIDTYIRSDDCGLTTYVTYSSIGFPDIKWPQQLLGDTTIDGSACDCYTGSDCFVEHEEPGCDDIFCTNTVCSFDQFCCDVTWDDSCVALAEEYCGFTGFDCDFPAANTTEAEACGEDTNGGCNSDPTAFESISAGDIIAGTYFVDATADARDTDWYQFELDTVAVVTWTVWSRVPVDALIINNDCANLAIVSSGAGECPSTLSVCLQPGTYNAFVGANTGGGNLPCDLTEYAAYVAALEVEPLAACPGFDVCPGGDLAISPNSDMTLTTGGIACAANNITTENTYAVTIDLAGGDTAGSDVTISCMTFGTDNSGSNLPMTVGIWLDADGGDPVAPGTDLTLLGSRDTVIAQGAFNLQVATFDPPICVPADSVIVATIAIDPSTDGFASVAGNASPSSSSTYVLSDSCGLTTFTKLEDIGFPDINWVVDLEATLGCGGGACEGDFNDDGIVNGADFGSILAAWGPCSGCPEDLNGDGEVSGADVGLLLSLWGPCP